VLVLTSEGYESRTRTFWGSLQQGVNRNWRDHFPFLLETKVNRDLAQSSQLGKCALDQLNMQIWFLPREMPLRLHLCGLQTGTPITSTSGEILSEWCQPLIGMLNIRVSASQCPPWKLRYKKWSVTLHPILAILLCKWAEVVPREKMLEGSIPIWE
jgi:hypothetical protein